MGRSGQLWIGHDYGAVSVLKGGEIRDGSDGGKFGSVAKLVENNAGGIWVGSNSASRVSLALYSDGKWDVGKETWGLPPEHLVDLLETTDGTLWASLERSLMFLRPGTRQLESSGQTNQFLARLAVARNGDLLLVDSHTRPLRRRRHA